jgi:hypothetical protein
MKRVYEIVNKGKGIIAAIVPDNLLKIYDDEPIVPVPELNKFIVKPIITITGFGISWEANAQWMINGVTYTNPLPDLLTVNPAATDKVRLDLLVADTSGNFSRIKGVESVNNPASPPLPLNTLLISVISVSDNSIDEIPTSAISDLISDDADNTIVLGADGKLYSAGGGVGSTPDATTTVKGKALLTTPAKGIAGINNTEIVTPLVLKAVTDALLDSGGAFLNALNDYQQASQDFTDAEITALKDGVATPGNTLQKLYNLILGASDEIYVANIAARDAYNVPHLPFSIFVTDDGDGRWAKYQATTTGVGATFVKISDPDLLNAVMSASAIKAAYESNSDTNAFTNALKTLLEQQSGTNTGDETGSTIRTKLGITTLSGDNTGDQDLSGLMPYAIARTTSEIRFDVPSVYNSVTTPQTAVLTSNLTGARIGVVQKIYSNRASFTFPSGWVLLGSQNYTPSVLNIIYAEWTESARVEYWIVRG